MIGFKVFCINILGIELLLVLILDDIFDLCEIFKLFVVMGGGVVGIEFGFVWVLYGVDVIVIEMVDCIILVMDKEVLLEF